MAMLCFDIRSLEAKAKQVDGLLDATDAVWENNDARPAQPGIHVRGRLSSASQGRFYFSGQIEGTAITECRRCLTDVVSRVEEDTHMLFAESGLDEADEDDVYPIPAGARQVDMAPAVREEWLLAVPSFTLCREDCKGLCPTCGADRNTGACNCAPVTDPRWAGLRDPRNQADG